MKFTPRRKFIKGQIALDSAKIQDVTPKSWGEIERLIKSYLLLTGGTISGNLVVQGNTDLGNADTDTIGFYGVTKTARQSHITDAPEITTADADATYGQPEADLINELKADVNLARIAINAILVRLETIGINKTS